MVRGPTPATGSHPSPLLKLASGFGAPAGALKLNGRARRAGRVCGPLAGADFGYNPTSSGEEATVRTRVQPVVAFRTSPAHRSLSYEPELCISGPFRPGIQCRLISPLRQSVPMAATNSGQRVDKSRPRGRVDPSTTSCIHRTDPGNAPEAACATGPGAKRWHDFPWRNWHGQRLHHRRGEPTHRRDGARRGAVRRQQDALQPPVTRDVQQAMRSTLFLPPLRRNLCHFQTIFEV